MSNPFGAELTHPLELDGEASAPPGDNIHGLDYLHSRIAMGRWDTMVVSPLEGPWLAKIKALVATFELVDEDPGYAADCGFDSALLEDGRPSFISGVIRRLRRLQQGQKALLTNEPDQIRQTLISNNIK